MPGVQSFRSSLGILVEPLVGTFWLEHKVYTVGPVGPFLPHLQFGRPGVPRSASA